MRDILCATISVKGGEKMAVCPFISSGSAVMQCHPACAMRVGNECAIALVAQSMLSKKEEQRKEQPSSEKRV